MDTLNGVLKHGDLLEGTAFFQCLGEIPGLVEGDKMESIPKQKKLVIQNPITPGHAQFPLAPSSRYSWGPVLWRSIVPTACADRAMPSAV